MMWLTLPPMNNYWHEPTCQQYNHEWCAEEKGHSWGPRHYVEEQLSSLLPRLRGNAASKASLMCTFLFCFIPFLIRQSCRKMLSSFTINRPEEALKKESPGPSYFHFGWNLYIRDVNDRPPCIWLQRQGAGESRYKCSHAKGPMFFCPSVLPCFVSAETSDSIEFFLLLKKLLRSFSANGAIWELLSSVWAMH